MIIKNFLSKYTDHIYALMRIVIGILYFSHGIQKFIAMANSETPFTITLILLAGIIETVAGFMIIIGWQTEWAAFIASGQMAAAYFKAHAFTALLPIDNGGEKAIFYCFVFLFIAAYGAGIWSVDNASRKNIIKYN